MHAHTAWHSAQGMAALVDAARRAPIEPGTHETLSPLGLVRPDEGLETAAFFGFREIDGKEVTGSALCNVYGRVEGWRGSGPVPRQDGLGFWFTPPMWSEFVAILVPQLIETGARANLENP